jgi:LysR family transcriptional regulator for bpeEF and oprC
MSRDLNDTLIFAKVVEQGSFTGAARALGLPKTTVSRKVQDLEERLGAQLLNRTTRKLGLTEAGTVYHDHSQRIARELDEAESAVSQLQGGPRGWLRMTASYSIGILWIAPLLGEFHRRYPDVRIDMQLSSDKVDLISTEIDVALRVGVLPDSSLIARRLATLRTQVYASPRYLDTYGEPLHPDDLQHHRVLAMHKNRRGNRFVWPLSDGSALTEFAINPIMVANDPAPLTGALVCGEGLMMSSDMTIRPLVENGSVRRVLAGWVGPEVDLNAVFAGGRVLSPKVRAFVDFLVERLDGDTMFMQRTCPDMCPYEKTESAHDFADIRREGVLVAEAVVAAEGTSPVAA